MELKTLIFGLFVSFAAFALKAGAGVAYLFVKEETRKAKAWICLIFAAVYGLIFVFTFWLIGVLDFTRHMAWLTEFFKTGMTLHFILAALLALWGIRLLTAHVTETYSRSRTWLALVIPCPVCFTVILLSCSFLSLLYPDNSGALWLLYMFFVIASLGTAFVLSRALGRNFKAEPMLGGLMLYISFYFLLTVFMVPQFSDMARIYRISVAEGASLISKEGVTLAGVVLAALASGFFCPFRLKKHKEK